MTDYTVFIAAWNNGATSLPSGASGSLFLVSDTTEQKLAKLNAWTAQQQNPVIIQTHMIYNAIVPADFDSLLAGPQQMVRDIISMGIVDASSGTNVHARLASVFAGKTATLNKFATLISAFNITIQWWQSAGYFRPFDIGDCKLAGVS
jgi:hypothetical protein